MATEETEQIPLDPVEPRREPTPPDPLPHSVPPAPQPETLPQPNAADALRAEYAEIAAIAVQAGRLGVTIDAADAMRKGVKPDALRRSVLDVLASRSEASSVIAAAPQPQGSGESPIVRRARERAGQTQK